MSEKRPWLVIAAIVAITAIAMWGTSRIHQEYGYKTMLPKGMESVEAIDTLEKDFGGIMQESVLIEGDDVLRGDVLRRAAGFPAYIQENEELWGTFTNGVATPLDQMQYFPPDGSFNPTQPIPLTSVGDSLSDEELTAQVEANIRFSQEQAQKMGMQGGYADSIDTGRKSMLLKVKLNPDLDTTKQIKLADPFVDYTKAYFQEPAGLTTFVGGVATQNKDSNQMMMKDTGLLFLLAFSFILIVLYITFRRISDVLLTLMVIIITIIWVMGLSGWLNFPFTYSSSGIMPLLLGIDIAYAIHVMSRYYEERRKGVDPRKSTIASVVTVGVAVFLTAATTAFGFLSFGISNMPPIQQFGALCVAGVVFSFILAVTLLPASIVLRDRSERAQEKWEKKNRKRIDKAGESWLDRSLVQIALLAEHHRLVVAIVTLLIIAGCVVLGFQLSTETDMEKMMPQDTPSAIAQREIGKFFGGQDQGIVLVEGDILEPANLQSMLEYEDLVSSTRELNEKGEILIDRQKIISLADLVASANNGTLPATRLEVQVILTQLMGSGNNSMISPNRDATTITLMLSRGSQEDMKRITELMRDSSKVVLSGNSTIDMKLTGLPVLMTDIMGSLVPTQLKTSGLALILCALIVMLIFKSVFFGLAATSVVFISIAVEIGALVLLDWPLDFMTVMISSLVIGAGIDFGIHVTHRFREEWHFGGVEIDEAIRRTIGNVGKALVAAAVTTAGAFAIIGTSKIAFMQRFGLITALSLIVALLASLLVLPSLLAWRAQMVERKRKANGSIAAAEPLAEVEG